MEIQLSITGIMLIALGIIHLIFPKYFDWKNDLQSMSLINRQMMYVHTLFIGLVVFLMGVLCLLCSNDIVHTHLGKMLSGGFFIFWFIRLVIQFTGYSSSLWKGKFFETFVHVLFSILWVYFSAVFFMIAFL